MSTLNLGLQCVGLMRKEMEPKYEDEAVKCNSLATLRNTAERVEGELKCHSCQANRLAESPEN